MKHYRKMFVIKYFFKNLAERFTTRKSHNLLMTWFCEITQQNKIIIIPLTRVAMNTKVCRMVTYFDELLLIKSDDSFIK